MIISIFVCYAHEDHRFAHKLERDLKRHNLLVRLNSATTRPDDSWERAIPLALQKSTVVVVILSPNAVDSWLVRDQCLFAIEQGKPLYGVRHRSCHLPPTLQNQPIISMIGSQYSEGLKALLTHFPGPIAFIEGHVPWWQRGWQPFRRLPIAYGLLLLLLPLLLIGLWLFYPLETLDSQPFLSLNQPMNPANRSVTPTLPSQRVRPIDNMTQVYVPAGEFLMGSTAADPVADENEKPQHRVYLTEFWIDQTEVTNRQYRQCVVSNACTVEQNQGRRFRQNAQPVVGVDWFQAEAYCQWVGGRLPTEAEWEKSARGSDGRVYPWGNTFSGDKLNYCDQNCIADWRDQDGNDGYEYTAPVGSYPDGASPYGALDMSGNVWEWVADWYDKDTYQASVYQNPTGPESGKQRVLRGGSWYFYGKNLRVANRHRDIPEAGYYNIGFRCVNEVR